MGRHEGTNVFLGRGRDVRFHTAPRQRFPVSASAAAEPRYVFGAELTLHCTLRETKMGNRELPCPSPRSLSVRSADEERRCLYLNSGGLIGVGRRCATLTEDV